MQNGKLQQKEPTPAMNITNSIFQQNENFIVIGLTGSIGSGQNDVVKILTSHKLERIIVYIYKLVEVAI